MGPLILRQDSSAIKPRERITGMLSHVNLLSTKSIIIKIQKRGFIKPLFRLGGDEGTRSRIFLAPSRKKFLDPGSRFRVLAKHRSAFLIPTEAKQLASFVSRKKPKIRSDEPDLWSWRKRRDTPGNDFTPKILTGLMENLDTSRQTINRIRTLVELAINIRRPTK